MSTAPKPPPGHFTVLFFASAGSFAGRDSDTLPAPLPLSKLFTELEARFPGMRAKILNSCLVTVNLEYVDVSDDDGGNGDEESPAGGIVLQEADEVAIIPPVSSG
jgi:molybdopterin converting factor small subunit